MHELACIVEEHIEDISKNKEALKKVIYVLSCKTLGSDNPKSKREQSVMVDALIEFTTEKIDDLLLRMESASLEERYAGTVFFDEYHELQSSLDVIAEEVKLNLEIGCCIYGQLPNGKELSSLSFPGQPHLSPLVIWLKKMNDRLLKSISFKEYPDPKDIVERFFEIPVVTDNTKSTLPDDLVRQLNNRPSYVRESLQEAIYLIKKYPSDKYCIACLGSQNVMTVGFLKLLLGDGFENFIVSLPVRKLDASYDSLLKIMLIKKVKYSDDQVFQLDQKYRKSGGSRYRDEMNQLIWSCILPSTKIISGRTLIISRNLMRGATMNWRIDGISSYLNEEDVEFAFDFVAPYSIRNRTFKSLQEIFKAKECYVNLRLNGTGQLWCNNGYVVQEPQVGFYSKITSYNPYLTYSLAEKIESDWKINPEHEKLINYLRSYLYAIWK
nr:hypothetical protein [Endozoicomonas sp.]